MLIPKNKQMFVISFLKNNMRHGKQTAGQVRSDSDYLFLLE